PSPYTFTVEGNGVIATNPIKSVSPVPPSPGESLIGESFTVNVEVEVDAPIAGVLQVSLEDQEGGEVQDPQCLLITGAGQNQHSFDITWVEPEVGVLDYTIWTQYRAEGECPVEDTQDTDISQSYQVSWEEENPVLELNHLDGTPLQTGSVDDLGDLEPYQIIEIEYVVHNPTSTNNFQIATAGIENPVNILDPQLTPSGTIVVGPGEEQLISITFEIDNTGPFSFDVVLEHDASNPSPYTFTVGGNGVMTANPIQSVSSLPISPGESLIGESYSLQINVVADAPISGVLQVSLEDQEGGEVQDPLCLVIADAGQNQHSFDFTWVEPEVGIQDYTIWTRYRAREGCPVEDTQDSDIFQSYQVNWEEDSPILELQHTDGLVIPAGEVIENGQFEYYKNIELDYLVYNTSTTSNLIISDIYSDNLVNLSEVSTSPSGSIEVSPGESLSLTVSFLVNNTGSLSFDLVLDHDASNPTPYRVTIEGMGVMINNPIKFVSPNPTSPGNSLIGDPYQLSVDVGIEAPDQGALQISLVEVGTDVIRDQECLALVDNLNSTRTFNLSWNNMVPGNVEYTLWTRYRAQGGCPIEDALDSDLSQIYRVTWEEEIPVLELQNPDGTVLPADSTDDVGQVEFFQQMDLNYIIHNTSTTTSMQVGEISVENLVNLSQVNVDTTDPITVGPDGQYTISVSFLVNNTGPFAFDLNLDHDASNISPYRITIQGVGEMTENPIQFLSIDPIMPGTGLIFDSFQLQVVAEVDPPAPGALEVSLVDQGSSTNMGQACISLIDDGKSINIFDLSWTETAPGDVEYSIRIRYQAQGNCPLEGSHDAELTEPYWVSWLENRPTLEVKRPEGVTIFDGSVDYVGEHDFFRIVEVMYVIENESTTSPMTIERIHAENLVNLRSVNVEPAGPIEIGPGEMQTIKITFQVLVVKPYSFDLLWEHDASNQSPYQFVILGDANLNLYGYPIEPWMYDFIINLINSEIFLKFPHLVLVFTRNFESMDVILN
ncbi:MAG: hypothetical protein KAS84_06360, partial [Anaerolineales bacterium]|nr:hypothetical protein [Anaerolineales bacterium]